MLGCGVAESPSTVALCYLNNLAYAQGMMPVYQYGYYVGRFGEYDLGAIRHVLAASQRSTGTGPVGADDGATAL
jgi:hypothetical protein